MVEFIAFMIMVGVFLISRVSFGEAKAVAEKHRDAVHGLELEICNLNFTVNLQIYELGVASVEAGNLKSRIEHLEMQLKWADRDALANLAFAPDLEAQRAKARIRLSEMNQWEYPDHDENVAMNEEMLGDLLYADECCEVDMDEHHDSTEALFQPGWNEDLPF